MECQSEIAKTPKLRKKKDKLEMKLLTRARKQEKKRNSETFVHYENSSISDYYFENGLRKVYPYEFMFKAYAKRRWLGRSIYDVLRSEFNFSSDNLINDRCNSGAIQVNGNNITSQYIIEDSDMISHAVHRHELPVLDSEISIICEDDDILAINKPASIPVHPCGQYTLNSVAHILYKQYNRGQLRFCHRLDRMTSGLLLAAKNYDASLRLASQISAREVKKYYICRTDGCFPPNETSSPHDGVVICDKPLGPISPKLGLHAVLSEAEGGKQALTHFVRLAYEPKNDTSLVLCRLFTGRTHQIRVHLQYLGFPITDDPLYNSTDFGVHKGKGADFGIPLDEVLQRISDARTASAYLKHEQDDPETKKTRFDSFQSRVDSSSLDFSVKKRLLSTFHPDCPECQSCFRDPERKNLVLNLHAYRYSTADWSYTAPLPEWACQTAHHGALRDFPTLINSFIEKL